MTVIVKDMMLPDCCASCPLLEYDEFAIDGYKDHWCNALDIGMSIDELPEGRRSDCPLVELIRCKDCKYNPKSSYVGCPMSSISGRTETDYCSRAERKGTS